MRPQKLSIIIVSLILMVYCPLFALEMRAQQAGYGWQKKVIGNLNITQASFDNWAQGGENTLAWQLTLTTEFIDDQERYNWSTTGKTSFGETRIGDAEPRKSVDEIRVESVFYL